MSYHDFLSTERTKISDNVYYKPDALHQMFRYDDFLASTSTPGKRIDALITEASPLPLGELWVVELKDFRIMESEPRPENSTLLDQTVERKIADSHVFLTSSLCPTEINTAYNKASRIHYCLHIEFPSQQTITAPQFQFMHVYRSLIAVTSGMISGRLVVRTPNHTRLEIINERKINSCSTYPWTAELIQVP